MPYPRNMVNECVMMGVFLLCGLWTSQILSGCAASQAVTKKSQPLTPIEPTTAVETNITKAVEIKF